VSCPYPDCRSTLVENARYCHACERYVEDYEGGDNNSGLDRTDVAEGGGEHTSAGVGAPSPEAYTIPLPPSVNRYWRTVARISTKSEKPRAFSTVVISREGRRFKREAREWLDAQSFEKIETGPLSLLVTFYLARRGSDVDNRLKPLLDVLQGYCYANDRQVAHLAAWKRIDRERPRAVFCVEPGEGPPDPFAEQGAFDFDLAF
jgi:Holliday junction resolvase RusA-like endonuclease